MFVLNKISKEFADKTLFEDIDLTIYDGERIGIVGSNGSGKSTFLNILSGEMNPGSGSVKFLGRMAYVKQVHKNIDYDDFKSGEFIKFLKTNNEIKFTSSLYQDFNTLSGGEKTKLSISFALSKDIDTLLLDEPTNNLDQQSINWLIKKLNKFSGTVIVVSHDRYFLNSIAHSILEFENGKIEKYYGCYDDYEKQKQERLEYDKKVYENKLKDNKKIKEQIARLSELTAKLEKSTKRDGSKDKKSSGYKDSMQSKVKKVAKQAEAKRNRLKSMESELGDKPYEKSEIYYKVESEELHSKLLIRFVDVSKAFNDKEIFKNVNFTIENGEKIALVGANGSGKTTLIKMILGDELYAGDIWKSRMLKVAYLPQDAFQMNLDQTIIEYLGGSEQNYKTSFLTNLCNMGMTRAMFNTKISKLSSGEKMKLKLNELILGDFNLLILDEPTNNLDIENKKFLESVLKGYKGNLIIVSHDKTLTDNVCNTKLEIKNKQLLKSNIDS